MDGWDLLLLFVAGYFSVVLLVRMMTRRRDHLVHEMRQQIRQEQVRLAARRPGRPTAQSDLEQDGPDSHAA